jgi:large-conductance mechanosensitive channel
LLLGIVAPRRLSLLNRLWLKLGAAIAKVVNPLVLALLFFLVVTPMAVIIRMTGKRPLRLARNPGAVSYWIARETSSGVAPGMRRQF